MHINKFSKIFSCLTVFCLANMVLPAQAYPDGITGYSGMTAGLTCSSSGGCHSGGVYADDYIAQLTANGSTSSITVARSELVTLTFAVIRTVVEDNPRDTGLNVAVNGGSFFSPVDGRLQLLGNQITHTVPQPSNNLTVGSGFVNAGYTWPDMEWSAATSGTFTVYGCGNLVNGDRDGVGNGYTGDGAVCDTQTIVVNDLPTISNWTNTLSYNDGDGNAIIDGDVTIGDTEAGDTIIRAEIDLIGSQTGDDLDCGTLFGVISCTDNGTQIILQNSDSLANYQSTIRSLRFENTSSAPNTTARTLNLRVRDSANNWSSTSAKSIDVDDRPNLSNWSGTVSYNDGAGQVVIDNSITITDNNNGNLNQAVITITNAQTGDDLDCPAVLTVGCTDSTTFLTLSGSFSIASYVGDIQEVTFDNTLASPNTTLRNISLQVRDTDNDLSDTLAVSIDVDDRPSIAGWTGTLDYDEGDGQVVINNAVTLTDNDHLQLNQALIQITNPQTNDMLVCPGSLPGGISCGVNGSSDLLTLSNAASLANYEASIESVLFQNNSQNPSEVARTVTLQVRDTGSDLSDLASKTISVDSIEDLPTITGFDGNFPYDEGDPATTLDGSIALADLDDTNLNFAEIEITGNCQLGEDVLAFGMACGGLTCDAVSACELNISGSAALATYEALLESVTYENTSSNPSLSVRTVSLRVRDTTNTLSSVSTRTVTISEFSNPPEMSDVNNVANYTENGAAVIIDSSVTITDVDSTDLNQASVSITDNYAGAQDVLTYGGAVPAITVQSNVGGVLTLGGVATKAEYETALESVTYLNNVDNPSASVRTLTFIVRDTSNVSSTGVTATLNVLPVNDAPAIANVNNVAAFEEDVSGAVVIDPTITISDAESDTLNRATISITGNYTPAEDQLIYSVPLHGVTVLSNVGGVLTLTGAATLIQYEEVLESVRYDNSSNTPNTAARTVQFTVRDTGTPNTTSGIAFTNLTVAASNDVPVIGGVDNTANYTENTAPVTIDTNVSISDVDSTQLNAAMVAIAGGTFVSGQDVLVYPVDIASITGVYDSNTGVLTLTHATGASLADFKQALESVQYQNTSDAPNTAARTIAMRARDTANGISAADTTTLTVTATNDAPNAVDDSGPLFNVAVNSSNNPLDVLANDTDVDPGDTKSIVSVGTPNNGGTVVIGAPCAADRLCYTPPPNFTGINVFTYTMQDGSAAQDTATVTIGGTDSDGDGTIDFLDNCPSDSNPAQENNDGDTQGDVCDDDDDNDGMSDSFEATHSAACGLDPFDPADAAEDCDGDGLNNVGEEDAGSNPSLDDVDPIFSGVQDITVNATGYLTPVNLGTITAVDGADGSVAVTVVSVVNVTGNTTQGEALAGLFRPGRTVITRSAQDSATPPNVAQSVQTIDVRPLADFAPDQVGAEGGTVRVRVYLNGESPDPVTAASIDYSLSGTSILDSDYTTAATRTVMINAGGTEGFVDLTLLTDGVADANETLVLTLSNPVNVALGSKTTHTIRIAEGNVPPAFVSLSVAQSTAGIAGGSEIYADLDTLSVNDVEILSFVPPDPNPGDTLSYAWTTALGSSTTDTLVFSSNGLAPGLYPVTLRVTDSGGASVSTQIFIAVRAASTVPTLSAFDDTDDDGDDDDLEGFGDMDNDGIPNYLDAYELSSDSHLIQNQVGDVDLNGVLQNVKLLQTEQGYSLRKGPVALLSDVSGIMVSEANIVAYAAANNVPASSANDNLTNVGGLYDFEIYNVQPGATVRVVLPLSARILEGSVYRKFSMRNGWRDFVTNGNNAIGSTRSLQGVCPAPGHSSYRSGLNVFDDCVQLTLQDGGPNDADGAANGVIRDPGGVAVADPAPAPVQIKPRDGGGGGLLHPFWLLLMLWGALRRRAKNEISLDSSASRVLD